MTGQVRNEGSGVTIDIWGSAQALDAFIERVQKDPPPLARVDALTWSPLDHASPDPDFRIAPSESGKVSTEITPDAATCRACLEEINDPRERRYRYPFTNCTHCGPRFSIVEGIPYDRETTSMREFAMCNDCRREYDDPANRRFHAQPIACPACGPRLWLEDAAGAVDCADPIAETAARIRDGAIVAIKGLGGFHLACDAANAQAVSELRRRKRRNAKPFAIMARDLDQVRARCHVSDEEAQLLASPAAPIVLLENRAGAALPGLAPGLASTGVMLPYTPLHHLLLAALDVPIVLTSGNPSGVPQIVSNDRARTMLDGIADACLLHDRRIANRIDDSVARVDLGAPYVLRCARGLAPEPIRLPDAFADAPQTLALGAELKSTFCMVTDGCAIPSQHMGDLRNAETFAEFRAGIDLFRTLFKVEPEVIAVDFHPDYLSTRLGSMLAEETGASLVPVQHHHAHLASCLAEHGVEPHDDLSVGIILDGTGFGPDGAVWGGEILLGGYSGFKRIAHLAPVALPGGEQAIREPWRNTVAHLVAALGPDWQSRVKDTGLAARLRTKPTDLIGQMIAQGVNTPTSTSAGRLFDAVAGALDIAFDAQDYEGQAAMELEALALPHVDHAGAYVFDVETRNIISPEPLWKALLQDLKKGTDKGVIAARFHNGLADVLADRVRAIAPRAGTRRVVLSGGVLQNRILLRRLHAQLAPMGLDVLVHRSVAANDGGISLGQAAVAALR